MRIPVTSRSEEHTSELQSRQYLVCRLLLEKKNVLVDLWGADHHGHVQRMKAAFAALGQDPDRLELLIMQFVNVVERGERASLSKRRGDFVTLDELVADIGVDATRYFMVQRSHDTMLELDLDIAREQTNENLGRNVQYGHERIATIL